MHRKVITKKTSYDLNLQTFKGKISEIIELDENRKIGFKTLLLTSNFQSMFCMIRAQKKRLSNRSSDMNTSSQFHGKNEIQTDL